MRCVLSICCFLFLLEPGLHERLRAQSFSRTFEFGYTVECSRLRISSSSTGRCRLEGYRTTKLSLYSNGTFAVEMEDSSELMSTESSVEGTYQKAAAEIVFTVERSIDSEGEIHFTDETIRVQYEDQSGGMYLRGGDGLLWGRGAEEREGLFQ